MAYKEHTQDREGILDLALRVPTKVPNASRWAGHRPVHQGSLEKWLSYRTYRRHDHWHLQLESENEASLMAG